MLFVLFLMILPVLIWIIAFIIALIKFIRDSIPEKPTQANCDAWEMYEALQEEENKKAREIDYYKALIANLEDLQRIIEDKPHDEKQLRQLITIDKQIHAAQVKLEKLGN